MGLGRGKNDRKQTKKLVKILLTQPCVKSVGLPTHTSKKPFSRLSKTRFPDMFARCAVLSVWEIIFVDFLEVMQRAEKLVLIFSALAYVSGTESGNKGNFVEKPVTYHAYIASRT